MPAFSCCEFTHAFAAPLAVHDTAGKSECASSRDRDRGGADRHNTQGSMAVARHCRSDLVGLVDGQTVKNIKKAPPKAGLFVQTCDLVSASEGFLTFSRCQLRQPSGTATVKEPQVSHQRAFRTLSRLQQGSTETEESKADLGCNSVTRQRLGEQTNQKADHGDAPIEKLCTDHSLGFDLGLGGVLVPAVASLAWGIGHLKVKCKLILQDQALASGFKPWAHSVTTRRAFESTEKD